MKHLITLLICCVLAVTAAARSIKISGAPEKIDSFEIVKAVNKPVVAFAAREMQTLLSEVSGKKIAVVTKPTPGAFSIILGDCPETRSAGVDVSKLPDEGFFIKRQGRKVFIAGRDHDSKAPDQPGHSVHYERGTLTGVYDFLERFAGIRFYFPGPYGTVIPKNQGLKLPKLIEITDSPDMSMRRFTLDGRPYENYYGKYNIQTLRRALLPFLRDSEKRYPFTHALNALDLMKRFGKTHPEYFALRPDGQRDNNPKWKHPGQLCFESGVREEIIQDALAYFSGKPARERGLAIWSHRLVWGGIFGIMPQDGMFWCRCDKCKKVWDGKGYVMDYKVRKAISDYMFRFYAEVCNRLKGAGLPHKIATMSYMPYDEVPDFALPKELLVQVAVTGLGGTGKKDKEETAHLKRWYERTGNKVFAWTYAMGKHGAKNLPGVPAMMPRHAANFIKTNQKYLSGVYFESESDFYIFNYLNYAVIMRMMWDNSLDVEKFLAEHFTVMFGAGAPFMAEFYADLEKNWTGKILGHTVNTALGPVTKVPSTREIWEKIYSPETLKKYNALFDKAIKAVQNDKGALMRLNFIRKELLGPIEKQAEKHRQLQQGMDLWVARVPGKIWLRPFAGDVNEVNTCVTLRKEQDCLVVLAECEEPRMKEIAALYTGNDNPKVARDSAFEVLLNPSGDRKNYFQLVVNANGALSDSRWKLNEKPDYSWNSNARVKVEKRQNAWRAEITIPLKSLGKMLPEGFPANFARNRVLTTERVKNPFYMWSLFSGTRVGGFHAIETWGRISFLPAPASFIDNGSFEKINPKNGKALNWTWSSKKDSVIALDEKCFVSGGRSLRIQNQGLLNNLASCRIPAMKPNRKYRLSFFLKTEKLTGSLGAGAWIYFAKGSGLALPRVRISGDNPWHRLTFDFTSPADTGEKGFIPTLGLWVWKAQGTAWFDQITLQEVETK